MERDMGFCVYRGKLFTNKSFIKQSYQFDASLFLFHIDQNSASSNTSWAENIINW